MSSKQICPFMAPCHVFHCSTFFLSILILVPLAGSLSFNFSFSGSDQNPQCGNQKTQCIKFQKDTTFNHDGIQLTRNEYDASPAFSSGRAVYSEPLLLWDAATGKLTDFTTHFSFKINRTDKSQNPQSGDGLAFFLSPYPSVMPDYPNGGSLGLFNDSSKFNTSANRMVAVEFDTFHNDWDPKFDREDITGDYSDPSLDHVGINVNSIVSNATRNFSSIEDGRRANAWVSYNASTHNLSVFLTYVDNPLYNGNSTLYYIVNLKEILLDKVAIGFSASTGALSELHTILSWEFSSTLEIKKKNKIGLVVGLAVGIGVLAGVLGLVWFLLWKKKGRRLPEDDDTYDVSIDDEFEKGKGPKRFPYSQLANATKKFSEEGKLGEGGFGAVYKGFLRELNLEVAIKKVSRGSNQGKKEYMSEVKIISRLRHRNLVQLVGWCHDRAEFMLVYEFMPNGSLDTHLYNKETLLPWPLRYKIVLGLASALLYLHEEWEQCVVHRDIKPSNVMLDSTFNAKLGDFGLARLVDHERGSQTTVPAGTMGYLAPECIPSGKASKESDVYSFGVVALEMACGRRPVEPKERLGRVALVEWVWDLYGNDNILDAADERLNQEFEKHKMERLMVVGLWCAHPDHNIRPSIRQTISALNFEAPLPNLPAKMPVARYCDPIDITKFTYSSTMGASGGTESATASSNATNSSTSTRSPHSSSSAYLLKPHKLDVEHSI